MAVVRVSPLAFVAVGAAAAGVHLAAVGFIVEVFGLAPTLANPLAFVPAFLVSFAGHYRYTFDSTLGWRASLPRWLAASLTGFALNQGLYAGALSFAGAEYYLPLQALVTLLVAAVTYMAGKFWAFAQ